MNKEIKRCKKCILSENFPKIKFDEDGVCNFCNNELFYTTEITQTEISRQEIEQLFISNKGKSEYDAIMCYSGGKDSTYTLKLAVEKYKLHVLSFTLDNGFISPEAFKNINKVVNTLGVDHITYKPSFKFFKDIIKISSFETIYPLHTLTRISANCNSCISIINNAALKISLEKKIPFILTGFTLGQIPYNTIYFRNNYKFFKESRYPIIAILKSHLGEQVSQYLEISDSLIKKTKNYPYNVNLLCLENKHEDEIIEEIAFLGWKQPDDVDGCSSNCRINAFNNYVHFKKYGFNPYELELSHLVRKNLLNRDQAIEKINKQPLELVELAFKELDLNKDHI